MRDTCRETKGKTRAAAALDEQTSNPVLIIFDPFLTVF